MAVGKDAASSKYYVSSCAHVYNQIKKLHTDGVGAVLPGAYLDPSVHGVAIGFSSGEGGPIRWLENAAGVACVTRVVVTMPVRLPASCAPSRTVPAGLYDAGAPTPKSRIGTSAITWLSVRNPVAYAVAPAAESVTIEFALRVSHRPTR